MALLSLSPDGSYLVSAALRQYGISMNPVTPWVLEVNASLVNNGTVLQCTSFADKALLSQSVVVTVIDKPEAPRALSANPLGEGRLELVWAPPFSPPGINTSYRLVVADLHSTNNSTQVIGPLLEPRYVYSRLEATPLTCIQYRFTVVAGNDAGVSEPSPAAISSIPAAPRVGTLQSLVTASKTDGFTMTVSFNAATTCKDFPVDGYYLKLFNDISFSEVLVKKIRTHNSSIDSNYFEVSLTSSDGLQPNMKYTCSLLAYNAVGISTSSSIVFYTTDVQSLNITSSERQLNVMCFFVDGTEAKGCIVCLERVGEVTYQMIPRVNGTAKGVVRTEFSVDCYNISVVDWEEDGSIGSQRVPINATEFLPAFKMCNKEHATQKILYMASIVTGLVGGTFILLTVVIILVILEKNKLRGKRKFKICQDKLQSFCENSDKTSNSLGSNLLQNRSYPDREHSSRDNSTPMSSSTQTTQSMLSVCSEAGTMV